MEIHKGGHTVVCAVLFHKYNNNDVHVPKLLVSLSRRIYYYIYSRALIVLLRTIYYILDKITTETLSQ